MKSLGDGARLLLAVNQDSNIHFSEVIIYFCHLTFEILWCRTLWRNLGKEVHWFVRRLRIYLYRLSK